MRHLAPVCLSGAFVGLAVFNSWALCLVVAVAAFVAYGVGLSVARKENHK